MPTQLIQVKSVRDRMMLPNVDRINSAISEIISGLLAGLESDLRTTLAFQARAVDLFYRRDSLREGNRFHEKLLLSRGLVSEDANDVEVLTAPRRGGFLEGTSVTQFDLRDTSSGLVDNKDQFVMLTDDGFRRGIVTVQDFRLFRAYTQITYDAGIAEDRDKSNLFLQEVPAAGFSLQGGPSVTFADADPDTITRATGDWVADGFRVGDIIVVSGTVSNDGSYVVTTVTTTVLTLATADELTAEVFVGPAIRVGALQAVPGWLKELATLQTMLELTTSDALGGALQREARTATRPDATRATQLETRINVLLDKHMRYEPGAVRPVC